MNDLNVVIVVFGAMVAALGLYGLVSPRGLIRLVTEMNERVRFFVAVAVRLGMGAVLIAAAPNCRVPLAMQILGGVFLAAAMIVLLMGPWRLDAIVRWWADRLDKFIRPWAAAAIAFGAFFIWAALP